MRMIALPKIDVLDTNILYYLFGNSANPSIRINRLREYCEKRIKEREVFVPDAALVEFSCAFLNKKRPIYQFQQLVEFLCENAVIVLPTLTHYALVERGIKELRHKTGAECLSAIKDTILTKKIQVETNLIFQLSRMYSRFIMLMLLFQANSTGSFTETGIPKYPPKSVASEANEAWRKEIRSALNNAYLRNGETRANQTGKTTLEKTTLGIVQFAIKELFLPFVSGKGADLLRQAASVNDWSSLHSLMSFTNGGQINAAISDARKWFERSVEGPSSGAAKYFAHLIEQFVKAKRKPLKNDISDSLIMNCLCSTDSDVYVITADRVMLSYLKKEKPSNFDFLKREFLNDVP